MSWTVYIVWSAISDWPAYEMCWEFPDWDTARRSGLKMSCLAGVRYVTVVDPEDFVAADYDRYTNRFRQYALNIGPCGNYLEREDRPCPGELYARASDEQVRCPLCRGWTGTRAPGMRLPFATPAA